MMKYIAYVMCMIFSAYSLFASEAITVKGPLERLSKQPGAHIDLVKNMPDNTWINLAKPAADAKWGVARGRAWAPKMTYAANLNTAFFVGTGRHGYVKPNGHYMDDMWAYDINAHAWICLYPGASKDTQLKLNEHGFEVTLDGDHQPVSYCSHAYQNQTYLPETGEFMFTYRYCPWWTKALPQRGAWLGIPPEKITAYNSGKLNANARHPILYNATTGKWERRFVEYKGVTTSDKRNASHHSSFMGVLEYIPFKKKVFYLYRRKVIYYDPQTNEWTDVGETSKNTIAYDMNACYDTKRQRMLIFKESAPGFWGYNLKTDAWETPKSENQPQSLPSCNNGCTHYDSQNDVVVVVSRPAKHQYAMHIYDCATGVWSEQAIQFPEDFNPKFKSIHGFYHPELNAHYYYLAGDSGNKDACMLVYRYKAAQ